jgi:intron-binding protein aquarius
VSILTRDADVILSLTRTSRVGYLRDVRRLTVALSRARLGLYILGRREVFESCFELRQAFEVLFRRPDKLVLVTGELWPSQRAGGEDEGKKKRKKKEKEKEEVPEAVMEGVEHLGQYVFEMTNAKVAQVRAERGMPGGVELAVVQEVEEGVEEVVGEEEEEDIGGFEAEE